MTYIPNRKEVVEFSNCLIENLKEYATREFDLPLNDLVVKIKFTLSKRSGYAGRRENVPFIMINFGYLIKYPVVAFNEYKRLSNRIDIGSFKTDDWKLWAAALIIHEFSHVIQFNIIHSDSNKLASMRSGFVVDGYGKFESGHGSFFQAIYRRLRNEFINHKITHYTGWHPEQFKIPAEDLKRPTANHPYLGKEVRFSWHPRPFRVVEYVPRKYKYPFIIKDEGGKCYRVSEKDVSRHITK